VDYASLGDLKSAIRITDTDSDTLLQVALDASRAAIDSHCNRTFVPAAAATARTFEPAADRVETDDFFTTTGLLISVGGTAVPLAVPNVSAGYTLYPLNAPALGEPYTGFRYTSYTLSPYPLLFATGRATATVTAFWGYAAAVPASVRQACILQASRIFARRLSPYGIAGSPEMGSELRVLAKVDPDVAVLLAGLVRY
jgi:hypothetical protein